MNTKSNDNERYLINDIKYGFSGGGPFSDIVVVSIQYTHQGCTKWITNIEFDSLPSFYITNENYLDKILSSDYNEELAEELEKYLVNSIGDIQFNDYDDILELSQNKEANSSLSLIILLTALTRLACEETNALIKNSINKYSDEVNITLDEILIS